MNVRSKGTSMFRVRIPFFDALLYAHAPTADTLSEGHTAKAPSAIDALRYCRATDVRPADADGGCTATRATPNTAGTPTAWRLPPLMAPFATSSWADRARNVSRLRSTTAAGSTPSSGTGKSADR